MANLASPPIDWGSGKEPQAQSVVVPYQQIAPSEPTYTGGILTTPAFNQLLTVGGLFVARVLGDGQLDSSAATIVQASTLVAAVYVKKLALFNTGSSAQRVTVQVLVQGSQPRGLAVIDLAANESADVIDTGEVVILSPGSRILAFSTDANEVDYYCAGIIEYPE